MSPSDLAYTEAQWREAAAHFPLQTLGAEDLALVHRQWMWSNQMRESLDQALVESNPTGPAMLATRSFGFMFLWYALLWTVIEALIDPNEGRNIDLRGRFRADIDSLSDTLRKFRNAVFHVPRAGDYVDARLEGLMTHRRSALTLRRIALGLGRLFIEEFVRRQATQDRPPDPTAG